MSELISYTYAILSWRDFILKSRLQPQLIVRSAVQCFTSALEVLTRSHGAGSPLIADLHQRLYEESELEAKSEASRSAPIVHICEYLNINL